MIKGGEKYYAQFKIKPDDGYCFNESTEVSVNGKKVTDSELGNDGQLLIVSGSLTATHAITEVEAKATTCTEDGNREYWKYTCTNCGTNFSDEEGTKELSDDDVVIPKIGPSGGGDSKPGKTENIKNAKVVLSAASFAYNGKVRKPSIKTISGKALKSGTDYTVKWSNTSSKNVGSYTVTITGKGKIHRCY